MNKRTMIGIISLIVLAGLTVTVFVSVYIEQSKLKQYRTMYRVEVEEAMSVVIKSAETHMKSNGMSDEEIKVATNELMKQDLYEFFITTDKGSKISTHDVFRFTGLQIFSFGNDSMRYFIYKGTPTGYAVDIPADNELKPEIILSDVDYDATAELILVLHTYENEMYTTTLYIADEGKLHTMQIENGDAFVTTLLYHENGDLLLKRLYFDGEVRIDLVEIVLDAIRLTEKAAN